MVHCVRNLFRPNLDACGSLCPQLIYASLFALNDVDLKGRERFGACADGSLCPQLIDAQI